MKLAEEVAFWKARYEESEAERKQLFALIGRGIPKKPSLDPVMSSTPELAVQEAEDGFISRMADDLVAQGVPRSVALQEAARVRLELGVPVMRG